MTNSRKREKAILRGVIPAIITPLHEDGTLHEKMLEKQAVYLSNAGVHGLLVNGTTGEGPFLSKEERRRSFEAVRAVSGSRPFLCLGCLQPSTRLTLDEIAASESLRPDFIVVTSPYYFKASQKEIVRHIREIARQSPSPIIVYNIPQCTHNKMEREAMLEISSMENVVGLKDSSGDFTTFSRIMLQTSKEDFAWIMGEDYLAGDGLTLGAKGVVTGLGNVWIEPYLDMFQAAEESDMSRVRKLQEKINQLYEVIQTVGGRGIPAVKAAASLLGRSEKWVKAPITPLNDEELSRVRDVLSRLNLEMV